MARLYPLTYAALLGDACTPAEAVQLLLAARRGDRLALIKVKAAMRIRASSRLRMQFMLEELLDYEPIVS